MSTSLTLGWLYWDLMNTYGDRGNVLMIQRRAKEMGITCNVKNISVNSDTSEWKGLDILFMGGAEDWQQEVVSKDLQQVRKKQIISNYINANTPGLFICGAYQFLGTYYQTADNIKLPGLAILPLHTKQKRKDQQRLVGDCIVKITNPKLTRYFHEKNDDLLIGYENHGGRTILNDSSLCIGTSIIGYGNNDTDKLEGCIYKNTIGTYLHGPILARNPFIADFLIAQAYMIKYTQPVTFVPYNSLVIKNRSYLLQKLNEK